MEKHGAIEYITNASWQQSRLGLERMEQLLAMLDNPQNGLRYLHIAGTNGKGSVSAMLAGIMSQAGYKTGLYTSPYINSFNERIQIDGIPISANELESATEKVRRAADTMNDHPTEFELVTAIALQHYRDAGCDVVVMEVGLGGGQDATNIIPAPEVAVITPVNLDHTAELGGTVGEIAAHKAGIIKEGGAVVCSPQQPEALQSIRERCEEQGASLTVADYSHINVTKNDTYGQIFSYNEYEALSIQLLGSYQVENAALALTVVDKLREQGWDISVEAVREGLQNTRWPARFEIMSREPVFIVDGGHNPQGVAALVRNLDMYYPERKAVFLTGVMADKDVDAMFSQVIPYASKAFTVTPDNDRALPAAALAEYFAARGVEAASCESVEEGVRQAMAAARKQEVICAFGSLYMAGAIRSCFR